MPEPYWPKDRNAYTLRMAERNRTIVRVRCAYCKRVAYYHPVDLMEIWGDVEVDDLMHKMRCEAGKDHGNMDVRCISPSAEEMQGMKIRRLTGIVLTRRPVWSEK
ncbi:hypothetical protein ABMA46_10305 [Mesorhizobium sp. CN5-321]|jgi:hypothetical protein|uniref:hypothetical protein n=1 Tax=Mesorhizobium hunchu TaxID=3157708 RepID=UPI0032B76094